MPTLVIVGAQWGDEAKGKLVDVFGGQAELVVRYAGGNNAGHTVIVGGKTFKFQLVPASILHQGATAIVGGGMVVDPKGLLDEIDRTLAQQAVIGELRVSAAAHVVFPYHRLLDALEEKARGEGAIGTTLRGIGPAYQDKVARNGLRMGELVDPARFGPRLRQILDGKNRQIVALGGEPVLYEAIMEEYVPYAQRLKPFVGDIEADVADAVEAGRKVLLEGAQGTFLDLDSGTYPYVTSSHPIAGGACLGTGVGPRAIDNVLGVCKAYTTRVGGGPFLTELLDETGEFIRQAGQEFGTVTGRSRRCGWLDLVALKHSARLNSLSGLAVTRLDVLSGLDEVEVCTGYTLDGKAISYPPGDIETLGRVVPSFETLPGWSGDLRSARRLEDLPDAARAYLRFIEDRTGVPVALVSIGPDREETIVVRPDLIWA